MAAKVAEVLYITERSFNRQILFVSNLLNRTRLELVIWLYPESGVDRIAGFDISSRVTADAMPVTTYPDHIVGRRTGRLRMTDDLIKNIYLNESSLLGECDSLCIYLPERVDWSVSVIFHEGVILVKDSSLIGDMERLEFKASPHAPSWW